jgi:hypothetical protein
LNLTTFFAGICISSPVLGFLPVRAALLAIENEPKPMSTTRPPSFNVSVVASMNASSAFLASFFDNSLFEAMASISSDLLIILEFKLAFMVLNLLQIYTFRFKKQVIPSI